VKDFFGKKSERFLKKTSERFCEIDVKVIFFFQYKFFKGVQAVIFTTENDLCEVFFIGGGCRDVSFDTRKTSFPPRQVVS